MTRDGRKSEKKSVSKAELGQEADGEGTHLKFLLHFDRQKRKHLASLRTNMVPVRRASLWSDIVFISRVRRE